MDEPPSDNLDGVVYQHRLALTDSGHEYRLYRQTTLKQLEADGLDR